MRRLCRQILFILLLLFCCHVAQAQIAQAAAGSLTILGRAKSGTTNIPLKKKRFYLLRGSREANRELIDKLKAANATSRNCFYCGLKASPEFMEWLKQGDCESVHCREITQEDIAKVPEFQTAYKKGLTAFRDKPKFAPIFARKWLVTNLEPGFRSGFYDSRKAFINDVLKGRTPVQTAMTDSTATPRAYFSDVSLNGKVEKFVFSNLVPIEIGEKSYVWVCEAEIGKDKITPTLDIDSSKLAKKCEVIVRDLPACKAGVCDQK
jgi:hypothetical protein